METSNTGDAITIQGSFIAESFDPIELIFESSTFSRKKKEERCRARCLVSNGKIICLTGGKHNHPPHTEKIQKIFKKEKERTVKAESSYC